MARVSLPLFLSRFRTVSPSASRESRYHDTPPAISAAHFRAVEDSNAFLARFSHFSRSSEGRGTEGKMLMRNDFILQILLSPTVKFSVTFASQERVLSCPFLETRSLSLPTHLVASLPPPVVWSHLVSHLPARHTWPMATV